MAGKISYSTRQTKKIAQKLAEKILRLRLGRGAIVIGLSGELGSGKTVFVQGFAKALGIKEKIHSPTFIIFRKHEIRNPKFENLFHFDAYRLKNAKEVLALGWKKIISEPQNIVLLEWPENTGKIFPKKHFWIKFSHFEKNKRGIDINFIK
jgi:tRNA threonylcarbamoyladenosine biosynthesis protein TsaE